MVLMMVPVMVTFLWIFKEAVETIFSHVFCQDCVRDFLQMHWPRKFFEIEIVLTRNLSVPNIGFKLGTRIIQWKWQRNLVKNYTDLTAHFSIGANNGLIIYQNSTEEPKVHFPLDSRVSNNGIHHSLNVYTYSYTMESWVSYD